MFLRQKNISRSSVLIVLLMLLVSTGVSLVVMRSTHAHAAASIPNVITSNPFNGGLQGPANCTWYAWYKLSQRPNESNSVHVALQVHGNAADWINEIQSDRQYAAWSLDSNTWVSVQTNNLVPVPGDIVVIPGNAKPYSNGPEGHVAYVESVNGDSFGITEQNSGDSTSLPFSRGAGSWSVSQVLTLHGKFVHIQPNSNLTGNSPSVIKNQYGELEAFARDHNGFIEHAWQQGPGGRWTNWSLINGGSMNTFLSEPAAALNGNYIEMFAVGTDHNLYVTWQNPNGSWVNWNKWTGGTVLVGDPVVAKDTLGRLNVFVRQDNGVLWQNSKQCVGSCAWNNWYDLTSSDITNNANGNHHWFIADDPTVTLSSDGRLELFARTADSSQNVFYVAQSSPGGSWGFWRSLGGYALGKQWVVKNHQGELEVFARARDSSIWHNWENTPRGGANGIDPGTNWKGWTQLSPGKANNPMVAVNADGAIEVFVRDGSDQQISHDYQLTPGGGWSGWSELIGPPYNFYGDPFVVMNNDGRLELFARGATNMMYHDWQNSVNGSNIWAGFSNSNVIGNTQFS